MTSSAPASTSMSVTARRRSTSNIPGTALTNKAGSLTALANLSYDFMPTSVITPYIGAGAGIAFIDSNASLGSTQFAWDALVGVALQHQQRALVRPRGPLCRHNEPERQRRMAQTFSGQNQNFLALAGVAYKFGAAGRRRRRRRRRRWPPPSFMVFFDWDRSNLSQQALNTIRQAADAYKTKGNARITATGHTDTSGPEDYNMALSLRRANAVKDALVRDGVPATAIAVIGKRRDPAAGADRRRRARAAEPPRRDRHPVKAIPSKSERAASGRLCVRQKSCKAQARQLSQPNLRLGSSH